MEKTTAMKEGIFAMLLENSETPPNILVEEDSVDSALKELAEFVSAYNKHLKEYRIGFFTRRKLLADFQRLVWNASGNGGKNND